MTYRPNLFMMCGSSLKAANIESLGCMGMFVERTSGSDFLESACDGVTDGLTGSVAQTFMRITGLSARLLFCR